MSKKNKSLETVNWRKIGFYILITFGFSWSVALMMKQTDFEYKNTFSQIVTGGVFMLGPALATFIIQKYIYKESFKQYGWTFDLKNYKWFIWTILIFLAIMVCTFAVIAILGNTNLISEFGQLDFSEENFNIKFRTLLSSKGITEEIEIADIPPWLLFVIIMAQGIIAGITINLPFMFGEEFGWRGLFLKETQPLGFLKSNIFIGFIWGLWHLPLLLMGHNYPNHPYLGILMMCLMTTTLSPLFAYVRIKTRSILGACMLHGMINGTGVLFILFVAKGNELYNSIAGWAGVLACSFLTICIYFFDKSFVINYSKLENEK